MTPAQARDHARGALGGYGWGDDQFSCLVSLWNRESGWRADAYNPWSGAYGIPQALPGDKMAAAGPACSLAIAALFGLVWLLARNNIQPVAAIASSLALVNVGLALFNLVPGFPLDGGRVFRSLLWRATGNYGRSTRIATWVGRGIGYLFIVGGILIGYIAGALSNKAFNFKRMLGAGLTAALTVGVLQFFLNITVASGAWMAQADLFQAFYLQVLPMTILGIIGPILAKVFTWYGIMPGGYS